MLLISVSKRQYFATKEKTVFYDWSFFNATEYVEFNRERNFDIYINFVLALPKIWQCIENAIKLFVSFVSKYAYKIFKD